MPDEHRRASNDPQTVGMCNEKHKAVDATLTRIETAITGLHRRINFWSAAITGAALSIVTGLIVLIAKGCS